jgi:hypothetical protein
MKNKTIKISLISLLFFIQLFAGVEILKFTGKGQNGTITLKWEVRNEVNLKSYVIERKTVNGNFAEIYTVQPKNESVYEFSDETAYKTSTTSIYIYRIKIVDNNGSSSYSNELTVSNNGVSGIKKTWGSIKALFR